MTNVLHPPKSKGTIISTCFFIAGSNTHKQDSTSTLAICRWRFSYSQAESEQQ